MLRRASPARRGLEERPGETAGSGQLTGGILQNKSKNSSKLIIATRHSRDSVTLDRSSRLAFATQLIMQVSRATRAAEGVIEGVSRTCVVSAFYLWCARAPRTYTRAYRRAPTPNALLPPPPGPQDGRPGQVAQQPAQPRP